MRLRPGTWVGVGIGALAVAVAAVVVVAIVRDRSGGARAGPWVSLPPSAVRVLATGLNTPWGLAFLPDGSALVTERDSTRLLRVGTDGRVSEVQRITEARPRGEGGLLGVAVSPAYATDAWVYVYYSTADDNRIARLHLGQSPQPILTGIPHAGNHNGGRLAFGPDGMLYAGTGDATDRKRAQDRGDLGGKILRITPDGRPAPGNPFGGSPVWSLGHRNVQGLAWDGAGRMYASEFGQNRWDELNRIEPGHNYGWPAVEGPSDDSRYTAPLAWWGTSDASPSGIAISQDRVYLACLRGTKLYRTDLDGGHPEALLAGQYGRLRHVTPAPDGSLWLLTSNRDGRGSPTADDDRILRLTP